MEPTWSSLGTPEPQYPCDIAKSKESTHDAKDRGLQNVAGRQVVGAWVDECHFELCKGGEGEDCMHCVWVWRSCAADRKVPYRK